MLLRLLAVLSLAAALSFASGDHGWGIDPNGGATLDAGSSMDPNGKGAGIDPNGADGGPGMDPNGAQVCYSACLDPNG
jgi:hypothetical protein